MAESFDIEVAALGKTSARVYRAREPRGATYLLSHGAGAPQTHPFLVAMAERIAARGIDVVTFNFLYTEAGRRAPDRHDTLEACFVAAIAAVRARSGLPSHRLILGGKSMGGRIATHVAANEEAAGVSGLAILGYPLHPPNKPKARRVDHLKNVPVPILFVQGSRDSFGTEAEMTALVKTLPRATLFIVPDGDHSLSIPKRGAAKDAQENVLDGVADEVASFCLANR